VHTARAVTPLNSSYQVTKYQLLSLMLLAVFSTGYSTWNTALYAGLGYELISNAVLCVAFLCYCCSASELTSTFPFPGGSYGFARCTVGFFPGYLVGCIEIFYYLLSLANTNGGIAYVLAAYNPSLEPYVIIILLALVVLELCICFFPRALWFTIPVLAVIIVSINFSYILGSIPQLDFSAYAYSSGELSCDDSHIWKTVIDDVGTVHDTADVKKQELFVGGWFQMIRIMPKLCWMFMGSEYVNLACDDCKQPRRQIPYVQVIGIIIIIIHNMVLPVVASSMYPGVDQVSLLLFPLNPGPYA
jgi:ethanolamine permease